MLTPAGLGFELLGDDRHPIPFQDLLAGLLAAELEPRRCRAFLENQLRAHPFLERCFDLAELEGGGAVGSEALLFDYPAARRWRWTIHRAGVRLDLGVSWTALEGIAEIVRAHRQAESGEEWASSLADLDDRILARLVEERPAPDHGRWPLPERPGLYRREHASLAIRSGESTLLTDPTTLSHQWTTNGGASPAESGPWSADAVLVSHTHEDHWHLPSVLWHAERTVPVIVPRVPRANLLASEAPAATLQLADQSGLVPTWGSVIPVGDLTVEVLPFYGEQPAVSTPWLSPALRNWGSCFRVNGAGFSVFVLADSGADPEGSMLDVLRDSVARHGPATALLSTTGGFPEVFNRGLAHYVWAFPFSVLQEKFAARSTLASCTLGLPGIVEACEAAQARYYLPYANGFLGLGEDPVLGEGSERAALAELRDRLAGCGSRTRVIDWRPGDSVHFEGDRVRLCDSRGGARFLEERR
jgi:L-ascorbate metabolism protein UlaG (beta-lactamase superfamily)